MVMQTERQIPKRMVVERERERELVFIHLSLKGDKLAEAIQRRLKGFISKTFCAVKLRILIKFRSVV